MTANTSLPIPRLPLWLTRAGMLAERVLRAFWPLFSILMAVMAALMLGLQDMVVVEVVWTAAAVAGLGALVALIWGVRRFHWPTRAEALARLDESLPGRPIQALLDDQAIGALDGDSVMLWRAHQARMADRAAGAAAVRPDLRLSARDPFALRYVALLALTVALLFGSVWRVGPVTEKAPGSALAGPGPPLGGWVEPPRYTRPPPPYLAGQSRGAIDVPEGSRITPRLSGVGGG
ncbi:MAG: DUF4175 family protein, partial [Ruegeria sp.]